METPVQIFHQWLERNTCLSVSGRRFILTKRLKLWLNSTFDTPEPETALESLFNTTIANEVAVASIIPPWNSDTVLIFCILLQLDRAHLLQEFVENRISDKSLPVDEQTLRALERKTGNTRESLADEFFEIQWQYCAVTFDLDRVYEWPEELIIPICSQNLIAEGRTAKLYEITIPEDFIGLGLAGAVPNFRYEDPEISPGGSIHNLPSKGTEDDCPKVYYRFVLKKFDRWNVELGRREMAALRNMRSYEEFVRPLTAFQSTDNQTLGIIPKPDESRQSYNILLQCCETDLGNYFAIKNPPFLSHDIALFWTNLSKLVEALEQLHGSSNTTDFGTRPAREYTGYHHDIKPSNILLSGEHFKLSDFGFAYFGPIDGTISALAATASFGTVSYGPPAPNIYTTAHRTLEGFLKFDLWSLGCVLSEAATWVVLGYSGIKTFATLRRQTLNRICAEHEKDRLERETEADRSVNIPLPGDYFHDGVDVLAAVTSWHTFLRNSVRRSDTITSRVLDIVDQGLLVSDIKGRWDAKTLYVRLKHAINAGQVEADLLPSVDTDIKVFLTNEESKDLERRYST
ncbi:hypothetical protein L207DRAFT_630123 [Hyaloscypha variabilis F]|uniref:non-specific serine/threonine protein kinase n=1 Tax=Hyaloscypha variabilis (strain UAMH 11265 / GT02V1 / F) TaxID=1149755 RepID=A0A2J6S4P4_HYAVF|nr:hypothetical protein L207DRAFT_630123 [Hyaloscypha variabilis F]